MLASGGAGAADGGRLIADAGDSAFLASGEAASLGGMAWGGTTPYRYSWSLAGKTDRFTRAKQANTIFKTDGLKAGDYTLTLAVTDAAGRTARDTVKMRVYSVAPRTILQKTDGVAYGLPDEVVLGPDEEGGVDGQTKAYPFTVPANAAGLDLVLRWGVYHQEPATGVLGVNDFDMYLTGPDPKYADITSGATAAMPEKIHVDRPKPGTYKAIIAAFANVPDDFDLTVSIVPMAAANPLPQIDLPATVRFIEGRPQSLSAKLKNGSGAATSWDLDFDGTYERRGTSVKPSFERGSHLATFKAVKGGFELRRTVAVTVAGADEGRANTSPFVIIGIGDSGINPYHEEFSAETYPDPEILRITNNFSRHPSEYIPGYPKDVPALPVTLGKGYLPKEDEKLWTRRGIAFQKLYWIPGTKIVGAIDWTDSSGSNAADDAHPILDDDGHGTETSSVSTGNRFGNCPACLLVFAEGLSGEEFLVTNTFIDIVSMSVGSVGNVGFGIFDHEFTKGPAERGQTVMFAAGNGFGNAFDVPMSTYTSDRAGPDWHVVVGAARTDNRRPIVGDGVPVDISSWGDGTIPSACVSGTVSMCNFGGTSAATPLAAGVFGRVLREVRRAIGDSSMGQRPGAVVAQGKPVAASQFLRDGKLTRAELWDIVFHTAEAFGPDGPPVPPYTLTWPGPANTDYLMGGYGLATPDSAEAAIDVALGKAPIPERPVEDGFFAQDAGIRRELWGDWNSGSTSSSSATTMFSGISLGEVATLDGILSAIQRAQSSALSSADFGGSIASPIYYLHHNGGCPAVAAPAGGVVVPAGASGGFTFMDRTDRAGDDEPCPNARATTIAAYFRPVGLWASGQPVGAFLPAGTTVDAKVFLTMDHPMLLEATGVLLAGNRVVGSGASAPTPVADVLGARCRAGFDDCWTEVPIRFETSRPVGAHELLTYQVALRSSENTYFGYEGAHASRVTITPAPGAGAADLIASITSLANGASVSPGDTSVSGDASFGEVASESLRKVELSVDDLTFSNPIAATSSSDYKTWTAKVPIGPGQHRIYARAVQDRRTSAPDMVSVFAGAGKVLGKRQNLPATGLEDRALVPVMLLLLAASAAGGLTIRRRSTR